MNQRGIYYIYRIKLESEIPYPRDRPQWRPILIVGVEGENKRLTCIEEISRIIITGV